MTETQIVWSSKCQSRRQGVTLTAWMWQNWKKSLQENQEFTKCLKSKCSKGEFLNNAWPKKKRAGVITSLHPHVYSILVDCTSKYWYNEAGPFFLLSKRPGVFRNKLGNSIITLFALNVTQSLFPCGWHANLTLGPKLQSWTNLCIKVRLLQFTQTLLRACFILLLTYKTFVPNWLLYMALEN